MLVTDIQFRLDKLKKFGIDLNVLTEEVVSVRGKEKAKELGLDLDILGNNSASGTRWRPLKSIHDSEWYGDDLLADLYDQLKEARPWWVLEWVPTLGTFQRFDGMWIRKKM